MNLILKAALPYLLAALAGFGAGWALQGLNVTAAKNARDQATNDFAAYRTEQQRLTNEAAAAAIKQQTEAANAWAANLEKILADKGAYERCVAAGKCGPAQRVCVALPVSRPPADGQAATVPATGRPDGSAAGSVPAPASAAEPTASGYEGLIADCQKAIGMGNALQADIAAQPGYRTK